MKNLYKIQDELYIIDNNEKITQNEIWARCSFTGDILKNRNGQYAYKVILTTNKSLIKDGVQEIDDEFLEWFVKNPSCEFVKIYYKCDKSGCFLKEWNNCCKEAKPVLTLFAENESKAKYFRGQEIIIPQEEPKQETIEEVAKDFIENTMKYSFNSLETKTQANRMLKCIEFGAKWQEKRMYSEEEVRKAIQETITLMRYKATEFREHEHTIIEQFKKK